MQAKANRILFVVNHATFFVSHRLPIALAARDAGYDVHVALPLHDMNRQEDIKRLESTGLALHHVPFTGQNANPVVEAGTFIALLRVYSSVRPDILHHITIKPMIYGSLAARLAGITNIVNAVPGLGYVFLARGRIAALRRRLVLLAYRVALSGRNTRVIVQNPDDAEFLVSRCGLDSAHIRLIRGSGVDLRAFTCSEEPDGVPVVLLASRMLFDKGVLEFVGAAKALKQQGFKARFILVGDPDEGNPASVTAEQLEAWNRAGTIEWNGPRKDMPQAMLEANIVCLPSYREGLPKVLLEAMATGRAIVTADVPGCREAVTEGLNGLLVPPRDPVALARAIGTLLEDPQRRREMGSAGRARAESDFGLDGIITTTLSIYREFAQNQL